MPHPAIDHSTGSLLNHVATHARPMSRMDKAKVKRSSKRRARKNQSSLGPLRSFLKPAHRLSKLTAQEVHDFEYQIALEEVINDELSRQAQSQTYAAVSATMHETRSQVLCRIAKSPVNALADRSIRLPRFVRPANAPTALSRCSRNPKGQRRERHDILSGSRKTTARERLCSTKESLCEAFPAPQKTFVAGAWETHEFGDTGRFSSASCPNFSSTRATLLGPDLALEQQALEGAENFCDSPQWPKYLIKPRPNTVSWCVPWLRHWQSGLLTGNLA